MKTREQLADLFTKTLNGTRVTYLFDKLGMIISMLQFKGGVLQYMVTNLRGDSRILQTNKCDGKIFSFVCFDLFPFIGFFVIL